MGLAKLCVGYILFRVGRVSSQDTLAVVLFGLVVATISVMLSVTFTKKHV